MPDIPFNKQNLNMYLKELAKEYRKQNGKSMPAEIILIGGASVVVNYGFREMTYDMDALINASSSMKDAINAVGDRLGLPNGWLNDDFKKTDSYTPKISQFSKHYRTFSNVVEIRMITAEYLIAMKMRSGRKYKYDRSDIIGILWEQAEKGEPLDRESVSRAVSDLYGSYDTVTDEMRVFVEEAIANGNYGEMYDEVRQMEAENKENLIEYQEQKPGIVTQDNVNAIIDALRRRKRQ